MVSTSKARATAAASHRTIEVGRVCHVFPKGHPYLDDGPRDLARLDWATARPSGGGERQGAVDRRMASATQEVSLRLP